MGAIAQGFEQRIAVTYVEWGDAASQEVVVPWTVVDGPASAAAFAAALLEAPRRAAGPNAIGNAIAAAQGLIETNQFDGYRKVIDFSGDSAYSFGGIPVAQARAAALAADIVINGLAILCRVEACSGRPVGYDLEQAFADMLRRDPRCEAPGTTSAALPASRRSAARETWKAEVREGRPGRSPRLTSDALADA